MERKVCHVPKWNQHGTVGSLVIVRMSKGWHAAVNHATKTHLHPLSFEMHDPDGGLLSRMCGGVM